LLASDASRSPLQLTRTPVVLSLVVAGGSPELVSAVAAHGEALQRGGDWCGRRSVPQGVGGGRARWVRSHGHQRSALVPVTIGLVASPALRLRGADPIG
jgi:hypothetical protein